MKGGAIWKNKSRIILPNAPTNQRESWRNPWSSTPFIYARVCVCECVHHPIHTLNLLRSQLWLCGGLEALEPIPCIRQLRVEADWSKLVGWFITGPEHRDARFGAWLWLRCSQCDGELYWFGVCAHNEVVVQLIWALVLPGQPPAAFWPPFGAERNFARLRRAERRSPCLTMDGGNEGFKDDHDVFEGWGIDMCEWCSEVVEVNVGMS